MWKEHHSPKVISVLDERLKTKAEESTRLAYTWLLGELEHLKKCVLVAWYDNSLEVSFFFFWLNFQLDQTSWECQEFTSKMCWPNIESGPSALTLMFHIRPSPMYVSVSVKLQSHCWVCDETKQAILIVNLADFLVGTHKRAYVNMWHENVAGSLETPSCFMDVLHSSHHYVRKDVATRSLPRNFLPCRMQQYMNKTRHGDIWTSVRTRQMQPNSPTEACFRARCSASEMAVLLTATHITGMCVRETWMSVKYALNRCSTNTYLLLNPGLPVFFSSAPHSFLPSVAFVLWWKGSTILWIDDTSVLEITWIYLEFILNVVI